MTASDVAAWVGLAVGVVSLLGGAGAALALAWRGGRMAERLERTERIADRLHSDFPKASVAVAELRTQVTERTERRPSYVDPKELP